MIRNSNIAIIPLFFFVLVLMYGCFGVSKDRVAQKDVSHPSVDSILLWSILYHIETVSPISLDNIEKWKGSKLYQTTLYDNAIITQIDSLSGALIADDVGYKYCPNDKRIILVTFDKGRPVDTMSYSGAFFEYRQKCVDADTTLIYAISEVLPDNHQRSIREFFSGMYPSQ